MLEYLLARGFIVHVFTNGMWPDNMRQSVAELIKRRRLTRRELKFVVNVNEDKYRALGETRQQGRTFDAFNEFCTLSFNIFESTCDLEFLTRLAVENRLLPEIRLGLASPVDGKDNSYMKVSEYPKIARKISRFSDLCQEIGIDIVLDCGFPLCMFSDYEIGKLYKNKTQLKFVCRPIPDIDPQLNVTHCYPLSGYFPQKLNYFRDLDEIRSYFQRLINGDTSSTGIYEHCDTCRYRKRGMCAGGCRGHYVGNSRGIVKNTPDNSRRNKEVEHEPTAKSA
jgi:radical SAM protein with 4Fe4S-binding SPASM domain